MTNPVGIGALALWAATLSAPTAPPGTGASRSPASGLCAPCLDVCAPPLDHEDALFDESADRYVSAATRAVATAVAIDLAIELRRVHCGYGAGHFGAAYDADGGSIETLARKRSEIDLATSAEVRSLTRVRAALYADTVVGLRRLAAGPPSQEFLAAYRANEAVLDGVIRGLSSPQPMRTAERLAVCEVLAAVPGALE